MCVCVCVAWRNIQFDRGMRAHLPLSATGKHTAQCRSSSARVKGATQCDVRAKPNHLQGMAMATLRCIYQLCALCPVFGMNQLPKHHSRSRTLGEALKLTKLGTFFGAQKCVTARSLRRLICYPPAISLFIHCGKIRFGGSSSAGDRIQIVSHEPSWSILKPGSGETVILVHGFGGSADYWRAQVSSLSAAGYRVLALDLLGLGFR